MKYKVHHITKYSYSQAVNLSYNMGWVAPRSFRGQEVRDFQLIITPEPLEVHFHQDFFGNTLAYFALHTPHTALTINAQSEIAIEPLHVQVPLDYISWDDFVKQLAVKNLSWQSVKPFTLPSSLVPTGAFLAAYARASFPRGKPLFTAIRDFMTRIFHEFDYTPRFTTISTPLTEVLAARKGVCQDFAHLAIGCLRSLGLPARYVSGYIETYAPDSEGGLVGSAASHAWFSAYLPNFGWVDFDPTNNQIPTHQHITVAWGRDYADVPPVKGVMYGSGEQTLAVDVFVERQPH